MRKVRSGIFLKLWKSLGFALPGSADTLALVNISSFIYMILMSHVDKQHMKFVVTLPLNIAPYHGNGKRGLDFQNQLAKRFASLHWNKCPYIKSFSVKRTYGGSGISNMIVKSTGDIGEKRLSY